MDSIDTIREKLIQNSKHDIIESAGGQNNNHLNLILLCPSCHSLTNGNRKKTTEYFQLYQCSRNEV